MVSTVTKYQLESIYLCDGYIYVSASSLEGNIWDGYVRRISYSNEDENDIQVRTKAGMPMLRSHHSSGRKIMISSSDDGCIYAYDQSLNELWNAQGHDSMTISIATSNTCNSDAFYSGGWDGSLAKWNIEVESSKVKTPVEICYSAHSSSIYCISLNSSNLLSSAGGDGYCRIWDYRNKLSDGCMSIYDAKQSSSAVTWNASNENQLLVGTDEGDIHLIDVRVMRLVDIFKVHKKRVRRLVTSAYRPGTILSCSEDASAILTRINTTHSSMTNESTECTIDVLAKLNHHEDYVSDVAWLESVDGEEDEVYTCSYDGTFKKSIIDMSYLLPS